MYYHNLALKLMSRRTKPYVTYKHHFVSRKYKRYVYNVDIDGINFWYGHLDLYGISHNDCYYTNNEEEAALWVYNKMKKHFKVFKKRDKKRIRTRNWQIWLINYQYYNYPKEICDLNIY